MDATYKYLFSPIRIGSLLINNRLVWTGHATRFAEKNMPNQRLIDYLTRRAKGGVGLIITEANAVMLGGRSRPDMLCNYNDDIIAEYTKLAESIHHYDTKIFVQLTHAGINVYQNFGYPVLGPSMVRSSNSQEFCHILRIDEIEAIIHAFGEAALRVKQGGMDGIELLASQGQLLVQFLSPLTNKRADKYGGSLENRIRFLLEVIRSVREKIGNEFPLGVRLCGEEFAEGGLTLDDSLEVAKILEQNGALNYLNIDGGATTDLLGHCMSVAPMSVPLNYMVYLASNVKQVVDFPIICVGRINDPLQAEKILADGHADMIGMARALICDADFPQKAREGKIDDIRKCIACNEGCIGRFTRGYPIACIQNPEAGYEEKYGSLKTPGKIKKVVVIGGGPAGMEAAVMAAQRGHKVVLYERNDELGGQIRIAAKAPMRNELDDVIRFLSHRLDRLNIDVKLGVGATVELIKAENPDTVVIATGSVPFIPPIPGVEENNNIVTVWDVLEEKAAVGKNVVIIDDEGHQQATGAAEFLADNGRDVEILSRRHMVAEFVHANDRVLLYQRLLEKGVKLTSHTGVKEISGNTVVSYNIYTNQEKTIADVDTIVFCVGNKANDDLFLGLLGQIDDLHMAGDCIAPRRILEAIHEGAHIGSLI